MSAKDNKRFVAGLFAAHGGRLRRFLATRLRNVSDTSDLAQEVYLRLLRVRDHELIRSPEAYLFTVASHVLQQHSLNQPSRASVVELNDALTELHTPVEQDPASLAELEERLQELRRVLETLPVKASAALLLHRRFGFSIEEVGDQLGVSRSMAKKYLARALLQCRQNLSVE